MKSSLSGALAALLLSVGVNASPAPQIPPLLTIFSVTRLPHTAITTTTTTPTPTPTPTNKILNPGFEIPRSSAWRPLHREPQSGPFDSNGNMAPIGQWIPDLTTLPHSGSHSMSFRFYNNSTRPVDDWYTQGAYQRIYDVAAGQKYRFTGWVRPSDSYLQCSAHVFLSRGGPAQQWHDPFSNPPGTPAWTLLEDLAWRPGGSLPWGWAIDTKIWTVPNTLPADGSEDLFFNVRVNCHAASHRFKVVDISFDDFEFIQVP